METGWLIAFTVFYILSGIIEAFIASGVAKRKGYGGAAFFIAALLSNAVGLLCACVLPDKKAQETKAAELKQISERLLAIEKKIDAEKPEMAAAKTETIVAPAARAEETRRFEPQPEPQEQAPVPQRPVPKQTERGAFPSFSSSAKTANLIFKEGRLVCSACGSPLKFNDAVCRGCGAEIVPVDGSDGGFIRKKL